MLRLSRRIINVAVVPLTRDDTTVNHGHQRNETKRITKQNSQSYVWNWSHWKDCPEKALSAPKSKAAPRKPPATTKMPLKEPQNRRRQARITVKEFEEVSKRRSRSEKVKTDVEKRKDPGQKQQADKQRNSHPLCLVYIIWFEKTAKQLHKREKRKRQPSAPLLISMPLPLSIL